MTLWVSRVSSRVFRQISRNRYLPDCGVNPPALHTLKSGGCPGLALLKCTSAYPASPEEMNLRTIPHLAEAFGVPASLSDHTLGFAVPVCCSGHGGRRILYTSNGISRKTSFLHASNCRNNCWGIFSIMISKSYYPWAAPVKMKFGSNE